MIKLTAKLKEHHFFCPCTIELSLAVCQKNFNYVRQMKLKLWINKGLLIWVSVIFVHLYHCGVICICICICGILCLFQYPVALLQFIYQAACGWFCWLRGKTIKVIYENYTAASMWIKNARARCARSSHLAGKLPLKPGYKHGENVKEWDGHWAEEREGSG